MPEVSVVIPSRNRSSDVCRAVKSALAQELVDLDVVVVLDATEDDSARRLAEVRDPRLRVICNDERQGDGGARNRGIAATTAPWIAFLDDDDVWAPTKLRRALTGAGSCGFVYAEAVIVDERWRMITHAAPPEPTTLLPTLLRYNAMPAGASNVVVRRELIVELKGFDPDLSHLSDWDLWIRLAAISDAAVVREPTVACMYHARNRSQTDLRKIERDFRAIRERHRVLAAAHGVTIDRISFDRWTASSRRRAGRRGAAAALYLRSALRNADPGSAARAVNALLAPGGVTRQRPAPATPPWLADLIAGERTNEARA